MYVHLSDAAVVPASLDGEFGRVENTRGPVHAEQIRQWCGNPDAQITVNPVIDLNEHIDVEAYEIRGRLREQTILVHPTCVFPWCTRPARALEPDEHDADCDHRVPYTQVKHSCSCNTARCAGGITAKTHGRWTYTALDRGTHVWTSPHGYQYLRDQHGTLDVSRDRHPHPSDPASTPGPRTTPRTTDPPPRTPPDHHRRGPRHVRGQKPDRVTAGAQPLRPGAPGLAKLDQRLLQSRRTGLDRLDQRISSGRCTWSLQARPRNGVGPLLGSVEVPASGAGRTTTSRPPVRSQASPHGVPPARPAAGGPAVTPRCLLRLFGACTPTCAEVSNGQGSTMKGSPEVRSSVSTRPGRPEAAGSVHLNGDAHSATGSRPARPAEVATSGSSGPTCGTLAEERVGRGTGNLHEMSCRRR